MTPIIAIDGPSGTGKGTLASLLTERLGWHTLDSGALYRVLGLAAGRRGLALDDPEVITPLAATLSVEFAAGRICLDGNDVTETIRTEESGMSASRVAAHSSVRAALMDWQRCCARPPGLVADGRDMGTVVFPHAPLKIFLDASPEVRANRRYKQLIEKGLDANLSNLIADIRERDSRDRTRLTAPLCAAGDAVMVDSTALSITEVLDRVLEEVRRVFPELVF
jgi:cytidylate kinase